MTDLSYDMLDRLLGGRAKQEVPCPMCSPTRKPEHRRLRCLGVMRSGERLVFACQNCGAKGVRSSDWTESAPSAGQREASRPRRQDRTPPPDQGDTRMAIYAAMMWRDSVPAEGTPVEAYWQIRKLALPIPPSIRFHANGGQGKPTLIHAGGMPTLDGETWRVDDVTAIHRTFIDLAHPKGRSHKQAMGPVKGQPFVCHVNPESTALVIGEGLEKTLSLATSMGVDGWSTCGKSFFVHLAPVVPPYVEVVTIIRDPGADKEVMAFAELLVERGIEARIVD